MKRLNLGKLEARPTRELHVVGLLGGQTGVSPHGPAAHPFPRQDSDSGPSERDRLTMTLDPTMLGVTPQSLVDRAEKLRLKR